MATSTVMARLSDRYKLSARTAQQVVIGVKLLLARVRGDVCQFRGRALGVEGLVGAVVLDFLERPEEEQMALLRRRVPEVEAMLKDPTIPLRIGVVGPAPLIEPLTGPAASAEQGRAAQSRPPGEGPPNRRKGRA